MALKSTFGLIFFKNQNFVFRQDLNYKQNFFGYKFQGQVQFIILFITNLPLQNLELNKNFNQSSSPASNKPFSLFFVKGNDERLLNAEQQKEIMNFIQSSSLKKSTLVYNSTEAKRKYHKFVQTFPWIKPHYAIKSNSSLPILLDLIEVGSNFDCASKGELQKLINLGVAPKDLVYSNSIKEQEDLEWASKHGVSLTTADTIDQLYKILEHAPNMRILWRIAIKQELSDHLSCQFSGKFGDDIDTEQKITKRMKQIQEMGINLLGVHFHCGSGQHGSSVFEKAINNARKCIEIGRQYGHEMKIMDIGGGFPADELPQKTINALKITKDDPLGYKVIAEPGRHFSAQSFYVMTRVIGKREKENRPCYHINESTYHCFNCVILDSVSFQNTKTQFYSKVDSMTSTPSPVNQLTGATIFGMTCDGIDVIGKNIYVPSQMKVNDWMIFGGMGAYTYSSRTEFNGMKCCEKIITWNARVYENELKLQNLAEALQL